MKGAQGTTQTRPGVPGLKNGKEMFSHQEDKKFAPIPVPYPPAVLRENKKGKKEEGKKERGREAIADTD